MRHILLIAFANHLLLGPLAAFGQARSSQPEFEVASIKATPKERLHVPVDIECVNGRFRSGAFPVSFLIRWSYQVGDAQVLGLPEWARNWDFGYDIEAKSAMPVSLDRCRLMMQSLLADRFQMTAHLETRESRGYALMSGERGPKLQQVTGGAGNPAKINGQPVADSPDSEGLSMPALAQILTGHPAVGLPVIDRTGLSGRYSFNLTFSLREDDDRPSIFTAVKDQLGLKLEATRLPVQVLVVDRIEKAGAN